MYINFVAPIGPGGKPPTSFPPVVSVDSSGPVVASTAASLAAPGSPAVASPAAPASSGGTPAVYPWVNYGLPGDNVSANGAPSPSFAFGSGVLGWNGASGPFNGEPPWSNALVNRPSGCCGGSRSILQLAKQHPWVTLGVVIAGILVIGNTGT
jgi:hypothetical protein